MRSFLDRFRRKEVNPADSALIQMMRDGGEQLATRPRETTHYLHFDRADEAEAAATGARHAGFSVEIEGPSADRADDWQVRASHMIIVDEATITAARSALAPIAAEAGGYYDGWDTYADAALDDLARSDDFRSSL